MKNIVEFYRNDPAAQVGAVAGVASAIPAIVIYQFEDGQSQYNNLSSEISATESRTHSLQGLEHQTEVPTASVTAHAAQPFLAEQVQKAENHTHALVAQRSHYNNPNLGVELGGVAGLVATGTVLAVLGRNAVRGIANRRKPATSN